MKYSIDVDYKWFAEHRESLAERHEGKTLAIRSGEIIAIGDSLTDVAEKVSLPVGDYLITLCSANKAVNMVHIYTPGLVAI